MSVGLGVCGASATAEKHHPPTCGPPNRSWKRKEKKGSLFLPPPPARLSFNVGEGSVGNGQGNGVHSETDKELLAT